MTDRYETCRDCRSTIPLSSLKLSNLYYIPSGFMELQNEQNRRHANYMHISQSWSDSYVCNSYSCILYLADIPSSTILQQLINRDRQGNLLLPKNVAKQTALQQQLYVCSKFQPKIHWQLASYVINISQLDKLYSQRKTECQFISLSTTFEASKKRIGQVFAASELVSRFS